MIRFKVDKKLNKTIEFMKYIWNYATITHGMLLSNMVYKLHHYSLYDIRCNLSAKQAQNSEGNL